MEELMKIVLRLKKSIEFLKGIIPSGGTHGMVLVKQSEDDYAYAWQMLPKTYTGYSDSPIVIGSGSKTFDTQDNLAYKVGQEIRLTYNSANYMQGNITTYIGISMTVNVRYRIGSGTYNSWILSPASDIVVPDGGASGRVLTKASATSYDLVWSTLPSGGGVSSYAVVTDANFSIADGTAYEIGNNTFTADRIVDVSGLTSEAMICNGEQTYRLTFSGDTVYRNGGAITETEVMSGATTHLKRIGTKILIIN